MAAGGSGLDARAQATIRQLELVVNGRLTGMLHGQWQGRNPGVGSDLADTRPYAYGDDVRRIDWAGTARSGEVQLRTSLEDRELTVYLVIDSSASMGLASEGLLKRDVAAGVAAAFGFLAADGANRVGGGVAIGPDWRWMPPRPGATALRSLLWEVLVTEPRGRCDLGYVLEQLARTVKRRGLVVIISDFLGAKDWEVPMRHLSGRQDLVAVEVLDRRDRALGGSGVVAVEDPETGRQHWVDLGSPQVQARYRQAMDDERRGLAAALARAGADYVTVTTAMQGADPAWVGELATWMRLRRMRAQLGGGRR